MPHITECQITDFRVYPVVTASVERIFSNFGLVQTKLQNRLAISKASKLVACFSFLRGSHDLDW